VHCVSGVGPSQKEKLPPQRPHALDATPFRDEPTYPSRPSRTRSVTVVDAPRRSPACGAAAQIEESSV
jgi:hypothetical protein